MPDHIIDTNVLLVASAAHPYSPFGASNLPATEQDRVFEWLAAFRADDSRSMVWDTLWRIYEEYRNKLTDQDYGLQVVKEKMQRARFVEVAYDENGAAVVPVEFAAFDPSDRKFLAVLLTDGESTLVNATDTDWLEIEEALMDVGHKVEHVIEAWLRAIHTAKTGTP
ncbi:MAG: hypothetical protein SCH98_12010 [Deferrisomatales bacterium]|nr:hypothetical protein [Deferrisomatales bacterium]